VSGELITDDPRRSDVSGRVGTVYLLHLEPGLAVTGDRVARHYLGWTGADVDERVREHLAGRGSPLVRAALAAGADVSLQRTWLGVDRHFERRLKNRHEAPRLCPRCVTAGITAGRGLLLGGAGELADPRAHLAPHGDTTAWDRAGAASGVVIGWSTLEDRRAYQQRERALIARFAPDAAAAIAAEQRCNGCGCSDSLACEEEDGCTWVEAELCSNCAAERRA
jgi:hypothetical protein